MTNIEIISVLAILINKKIKGSLKVFEHEGDFSYYLPVEGSVNGQKVLNVINRVLSDFGLKILTWRVYDSRQLCEIRFDIGELN